MADAAQLAHVLIDVSSGTSGPGPSVEVAGDGAVVDVDALVGELAVGDREDRAGVDRRLGPVGEAPDADDIEDDDSVILLANVDQRVLEPDGGPPCGRAED